MPERLQSCGLVAFAVVTLACAFGCFKANALQGSSAPDLRAISTTDRQMIEATCRLARQKSDPAAYSRCLREQLDALRASGGSPDLSALSADERQMIESACRPDRQISGPAAYYRCAREQLDALLGSGGSPDLSTVATAEQQKIESACQVDGRMNGPAAYYRCLRKKLDALSKQQTSEVVASPSKKNTSSSSDSATASANTVSPPAAPASEGAGSSPAIPRSEADPTLSNSNESAEPSPRFSLGKLAGWFLGLFIVGLLAKIVYDRVNRKTCGRCGNAAPRRGEYCADCVAEDEEVARLAVEQEAAEERARAEAERFEREQWELEESRRASELAELHRLSGPQFDDLIASLFRKDGYTVRHGGEIGNEGIDLVLQVGQQKDVAQCKRSTDEIGSSSVRAFYGALMHASARHGFIVTTASFNQSARDFVRGKAISLISSAEILQWMNGTYSSREHEAIRTTRNGDSKPFDPYAVLGINHDASPEEIRNAYRRQMVNYHPDKVAHLGGDLQELAKTKAQEINRAYEDLAHSS